MTHPPELDHLVIAITDWERSNEFYGRVLRAEVIGMTDDVELVRDPGGVG